MRSVGRDAVDDADLGSPSDLRAANPGNGDRILGGISAADGKAWAVGAYDTDSGRNPLIGINAGWPFVADLGGAGRTCAAHPGYTISTATS